MPDIWEIASIAAKFGLYLGVFCSAGLVVTAVLFGNLVEPVRDRIRRVTAGFAVLILLASCASFMLQGAALTGDASGLTDPDMLGILWQTTVGDVLVARVAGAILILIGVFLPGFGMWVALTGGLIALWSFTQTGHIPDKGIFTARIMLFAHLLGITFWIGILSPLRWLCKDRDTLEEAADLGRKFGNIAMGVVPILIVAGVLIALNLTGGPAAIISSDYGRVLMVKVGLVALLLILAAINKLRHIPAMHAGNHEAARHLSRMISLEWLAVICILATTAVLTSAVALPHLG